VAGHRAAGEPGARVAGEFAPHPVPVGPPIGDLGDNPGPAARQLGQGGQPDPKLDSLPNADPLAEPSAPAGAGCSRIGRHRIARPGAGCPSTGQTLTGRIGAGPAGTERPGTTRTSTSRAGAQGGVWAAADRARI